MHKLPRRFIWFIRGFGDICEYHFAFFYGRGLAIGREADVGIRKHPYLTIIIDLFRI